MTSIKPCLFRTVRLADRIASQLPAVAGFRPLKGSFSAVDVVRDGALEGKVLLERQSPGPCPEQSITARSGLGQHDHQPWPVFWSRQDEATLTGRIRLWRNSADQYCAEGNYHFDGRRRLSEDGLFSHMLPGPSRRLEGAWTSIASNWGDGRNYYHWITDNLTRLLVRERLPEETRILLPASQAGYIRETLHLLGIADLASNPDETHLRIERFYFCSPTAMSGVWNPVGFDWLRNNFSHVFAPPVSGRPVFLTRRGGSRIPAVLPEIERLMDAAGFDILDCGKLTVREQIERVSAAPAVAGIHGAAMTNILWCPQGTPVLEIFEPSYLNACYEQIAFQGRLRYQPAILDGNQACPEVRTWLDSLTPLTHS